MLADVQDSIIRTAALASEAAYPASNSDTRSIHDKAGVAGLTNVRLFTSSKTGADGFVADHFLSGSKLLVFRGTSGGKDIVKDLRVRQVKHQFGKVHEGFYEQLVSVWFSMMSHIGKSDRLIITGHSLGGALAALAALEIKTHVQSVAGCYTFGQPRCGNAEWARKMDAEMNGRYLRFVNQSDPVPRLPFMLGMYRHSGDEVFRDSAGKTHINPSIFTKLKSDALDIAGGLSHSRDVVLSDHSMSDYVRWLIPQNGKN